MKNYITATPAEIITGLRYLEATAPMASWTSEIIDAAINLIREHATEENEPTPIGLKHRSKLFPYLIDGEDHFEQWIKEGLNDYEDHNLQLIAIELQRRDIPSIIQCTGGGYHHLEILNTTKTRAITIVMEYYGIDLQEVRPDDSGHDFIYSIHADATCEDEGYRPNPIEYAETIERAIALLK